MRDFLVLQQLRDYADYPSASAQAGVGDGPHQADLASAVDQFDAALSQKPAGLPGCLSIDFPGPGTGTAKHADSFQHDFFL